MVYSFYFLLVGSRRNECNSLWEELRGRSQKSTATQKVCLPPFLLALTLYLLWSILFIFCVLVPHGMNPIVFGKIRGRGQKSTATQKVCLPAFLFALTQKRKNDILRQYNDKFIMYSNSLRYHLITSEL